MDKKEIQLQKKREWSRKHYQENKEYYREKRLRWTKENKEYSVAMYRKKHLRYKFNITPEQYAEMEKKQEGVCAICKLKSKKKLCIDHCHETNQVRGLLCVSCNFGIGYLQDDIKLLEKAKQYLYEYKSNNPRG